MSSRLPANIVRLLETVAGLDAASLGGEAVLPGVLENEARRWNIGSVREYCALIEQHEGMLRDLLSAAVVPETFLFRYPKSFEMLARWARDRLHRYDADRRLRILCVPCASGEEVYSIAITLRQAGLAAGQFAIEGIDLCPDLIEKAISGVYHDYSFRTLDLSVRDTYFAPHAGGYTVREEIRESVTFRAANFFDLETSSMPGEYDVIFCRNLLIYLTSRARSRCFRQLERWLAHGGLLFLGPAEVWMAAKADWKVHPYPMAFACTPPEACASAGDPPVAGGSPTPARLMALLLPAGRQPAPSTEQPPVAAPAETPGTVPTLTRDRIKQLADGGRLVEAAAAAAELIRSAEPDPDLLCLAGVLQSALGKQREAERLFRKALYLDPKHVESLLHLALAKERAGRADLARQLRRRAAVVPGTGGPL
jgi:chemotaxis protein methyltransferase WspC